jgi:hypothetical protein
MVTPVPALPVILVRMTIMPVVPVTVAVIVGTFLLISRVHVNAKFVCF